MIERTRKRGNSVEGEAVTYKLLVVHGVDGSLGLVLRSESDETETTGAASSGLTLR